MHGMVIDMEEARLHTLAQVTAFLDGTAEGAFRVSKMERHRFIERVLTRFGYAQHGRVNRGVLLRDLEPFVILGFHSDNGSEYINFQVATLLETLRIEFTKSRPRHSNDNALEESKNGAVLRKHWGYAHIPQQFAEQVNAFCANHLNPYVNFHRPCFFPETITEAKGKERNRYRYEDMKTPYEKLKS